MWVHKIREGEGPRKVDIDERNESNYLVEDGLEEGMTLNSRVSDAGTHVCHASTLNAKLRWLRQFSPRASPA